MITAVPELTMGGQSLLIRAISGEQITFTKFKIGNGELTGVNAETLDEIINPIVEFPIIRATTAEEGYIELVGQFDSGDIPSDFRWRELGVYAKGEDNVERLYAYSNDGDNAGMLKANATNVVVDQTISLIVAIGEATNVTAIISPSAMYAGKQEFDDHVNNKENPHEVKPDQIGLGNVVNVSPEDMAPAWTLPDSTDTQEINPGETMSTMLGKIARAIKNLIAHVRNKNNPHGATYTQVGAAAKEHNHSAADINSGILGLARGGTGVDNLVDLRKLIGGQIQIGSYAGNGADGRDINLGYMPDALILSGSSRTTGQPSPQCYFLTKDIQIYTTGHGGHDIAPQTWNSSCSILMISSTGFKVDTTINKSGWTYVYAAISIAK